MKRSFLLLVIACSLFQFSCTNKRSSKPRVLIFSKTMGFHHASIPKGIDAIIKLGQENGFDVDTTTNSDKFNDDTLKQYSAVIFLSTTGHVLDYRQRAAFERYIQAGGGFVGVHAATDTEYDWGWYGRLVGAYFNGHPKPQEAKFIIKDKNFPATKFFKDTVWTRTDELYNFKKINPEIHVLITIDEKSYEGGTNGAFHPMSWYHDYDGGRAFYTEMGHTDESYSEPLYLQHLLGGIEYAIGDNKELDYSKVTAQMPPDEDRFTKTSLVKGVFFEPTEMTILPNLDIIVLQRRGEILKYDHITKQVKQVGFLNVYWKTEHTPGVNSEEGLLGISKDPHFDKNHWVYIYYSPKDTSVNRLSRFTFENDTIDVKSEKIILQLYEQREICCHTGGSVAFGPDGLLYFSAGDNSTPFNEPGAKYVSNSFAPLNDVPGHQQYDSRRSAGNTNDLRGKINRIRVMDDGTYQIPEGNLFPKGEPNTRPEIYVMGDRNPYRISVDQKNSFLYWGEVGPDANNDSMETRGPRGYDEINQARKAGFFGWPLFVGDNYPYRQYDYATGKSGNLFDPAHPVNDSRNNTGLQNLPPAQPAFIWYPYAASPDFPELGSGGRTAMAGPVYYTSMFPEKTRLPEYYNGKLFIYDWIRGWIFAVTMLPNGDFDEMEPFMEHTKLNNCIDMEVGPDGKLYLLEYGTGWFQRNADAGLSCIDYNGGNRPPEIKAIHVDKTSGVLPFHIKATVDAKDPDKDALSYVWTLGNQTKKTTTPELDYTFNTAGDYNISVEVKDEQGASTKSDSINVYAGNAAPVVSIQLTGGNKSFYLPGFPVKYAVDIKDNDTFKVDLKNLFVAYDYKKDFVPASNPEGHQEMLPNVSGKILTQTLDCKNCHKEDEKSVGPAFMLVSKKYANNPKAHDYLSQKIRSGGAGVWGQVAMAAHPDISQKDLDQILSWIFSLSDKNARNKSLPQEGSIVPPAKGQPNASLVLTASYTDKPGNNIKPLTGNALISLPDNNYSFSGNEKMKGFSVYSSSGKNFLVIPHEEGWFMIGHTDLTDVHSINIFINSLVAAKSDYPFEIKIDSPDGKVIGKGSVPKLEDKSSVVHINIDPVTDGNFHDIYFIYKPVNGSAEVQSGVASVQFNGK